MIINSITNTELPLRWDGNNYFISNAGIVENCANVEISPFDAELAQKLKEHILENQSLKLKEREGYYELPILLSK